MQGWVSDAKVPALMHHTKLSFMYEKLQLV